MAIPQEVFEVGSLRRLPRRGFTQFLAPEPYLLRSGGDALTEVWQWGNILERFCFIFILDVYDSNKNLLGDRCREKTFHIFCYV